MDYNEIREELLDRLMSVMRSIECYIKKTDELKVPCAEYKMLLKNLVQDFTINAACELITKIHSQTSLYQNTEYSEKIKKSINKYYREIEELCLNINHVPYSFVLDTRL